MTKSTKTAAVQIHEGDVLVWGRVQYLVRKITMRLDLKVSISMQNLTSGNITSILVKDEERLNVIARIASSAR